MAEVTKAKLVVKSESPYLVTHVAVDYRLEFGPDEIARSELFELRIELVGYDFFGDPQSEDRAPYPFLEALRKADRPPAIVVFDFPLEIEIDVARWPGVKGPIITRQDYTLVKATQESIEGSETRSFLTGIFQSEDPGSHTKVIRGRRFPNQPNDDEIQARVGLSAFRRVERVSNPQNVKQLQIKNAEELDHDPELPP